VVDAVVVKLPEASEQMEFSGRMPAPPVYDHPRSSSFSQYAVSITSKLDVSGARVICVVAAIREVSVMNPAVLVVWV
jgi:hypothetical protein